MRNVIFMAAIFVGLFGLFTTYSARADTINTLTFTTNTFLDTGVLPVLYTCDGKNLSPQLSWNNPPANTQTYAVIVSDPNAPGGVWYHWVIYNIPKTITKIDEGTTKLPAGTLVGKNSYKEMAYNGPCPPKGSTHTYVFTLYALDTKLSLPAGASAMEVTNAMQHHIVQQAKLTAVYSRWLT